MKYKMSQQIRANLDNGDMCKFNKKEPTKNHYHGKEN